MTLSHSMPSLAKCECVTTSPYVKPISCSSQWCWNTSCSYKNQLEFKLPLISLVETHFLQMNIQIRPIESPSLHFIQLNTFQQKKLHFLQTIFILSSWRPCQTHQMKETILQLISSYLSSALLSNNSYTGQPGTNTIFFICSIWPNERNKRRCGWAMRIPFSCFSWKRNFWKGSLFSWQNRACSLLKVDQTDQMKGLGWRPHSQGNFYFLLIQFNWRCFCLLHFPFGNFFNWFFHFIWMKDGLLKETDETKAQINMMHPFPSDEDQKSLILFNWILKARLSIY